MSGELEAAGAMATAGLVASVVEGREPAKPGEGACLNCDAQLQGKFCHNCGQAARANRKGVHLLEEVLHSLFYFDTKLWRTLPLLLGRPGTLTRNYIYGKRARYVSPLATFLLSIFFLFFAFSSVKMPENGVQLDNASRAELVQDIADARTGLAQAERELAQAQANPDPAPTEGLNVRLAEGALRRAQAEVRREEQALARRDAREAERARAAAEATASGSTEIETTTVAPGVRVERSSTEAEADTWQEQVSRWARREEFRVHQRLSRTEPARARLAAEP